MNSLIKDNGTCIPDNFTIDDIINIMYKKHVHKGIIIKTDDTFEEITFYNNPLEDKLKEQSNNYRYIELSLFKFNLIMYIQLYPVNNIINKKATKLFGKGKIHGDVIISSLLLMTSLQYCFHSLIL